MARRARAASCGEAVETELWARATSCNALRPVNYMQAVQSASSGQGGACSGQTPAGVYCLAKLRAVLDRVTVHPAALHGPIHGCALQHHAAALPRSLTLPPRAHGPRPPAPDALSTRPPSMASPSPTLPAPDEQPWDYARAVRSTVVVLQYSYPVLLLVFFLVAFTARSIAASTSNANVAKPTTTGPGGKPLPATDPTRNFVKKTSHDDVTHSQKLLFTWLSLFAAATFVGNATVSVAHALADQTDTWWAGNNVVVCARPPSWPCPHALC